MTPSKVADRVTVFLDRDGVINVDRPDYVRSWSEFQFLPKVFEALRLLKKNKIRVIIITNQSAVNRGLMTLDALLEIHEKMLDAIRKNGGEVEAIYYCPHAPSENCECRKPKPGLVLRAVKERKVDLARSYFVGDSEKDEELARALELKFIRVVQGLFASSHPKRSSWTTGEPLYVKNLREAVNKILSDLKKS